MQISTNELRQVVHVLLDHLEANGKANLEIDRDYYWWLSPNQVYDPCKEPTEFTLGQLCDDWAELKGLLDGRREPLGFALVWLSAILRAIGDANVA